MTNIHETSQADSPPLDFVMEQTTQPESPEMMPGTPSTVERRSDQVSYVYAIGHVEPRFPNLTVEREFAQVVSRYNSKGKTDQQIMHMVLSERENRYLARQMCWLFSVEQLPTYKLIPRDQADWDLLIESLRTNPQADDLEVIVGLRGPLAMPDECGGTIVPVVAFDQLYTFQRDDLLAAIPTPKGISDKEAEIFKQSAGELFDRIMQIADNSGSTDEHRALNYLTVRYPTIYAVTHEAYQAEKSLSSVEVRPSQLSDIENILDVIFSYTDRHTDVTDKYFVRVNVSGEFPFVVSKLQRYYDR